MRPGYYPWIFRLFWIPPLSPKTIPSLPREKKYLSKNPRIENFKPKKNHLTIPVSWNPPGTWGRGEDTLFVLLNLMGYLAWMQAWPSCSTLYTVNGIFDEMWMCYMYIVNVLRQRWDYMLNFDSKELKWQQKLLGSCIWASHELTPSPSLSPFLSHKANMRMTTLPSN